jgi:FKBP-type peptidyl-prolyl cis-trans isomerase (trigger factor)
MTKPTIMKKSDGTISFDLTIEAKTIAVEYQKALREVAKTAQIKGFRPGKAPLAMVESQTDKSKLYSHVLDHLLSPAYSDVIHDNKLVPLVEPKVTPKSMEEDKDWVMSVEVATSPEVEVGEYKKYVKAALVKHEKAHKEADKKAGEDKAEKYAHSEKEEQEHKLNTVFDALLDNAKLEVSPLLIDEETKSALSRLVNQLQGLKLTFDDYAKSIKKTSDELIAEYKKAAEANLKIEFILQKLIEEQKPLVSDEEIEALKPQKGQESYAKYVLQKRKVLDLLSEL